MNAQPDEREGKPSASGIEQMSLCPGSWNAQKHFQNEESSDSRSGDLIHAALSGDSRAYDAMSSDEVRKFETLESRLREAKESVGFLSASRADELRMWGANRSWSGKADRVEKSDGQEIFLSDFKSGWLGAEAAPSNLQLRGLAVLAADTFGASTVYVALIPATGKATVAVYDIEAIYQARYEVYKIINDSVDAPNPPRIPGEKQCRYCRAKAHCVEAHEMATAISVIPKDSVTALTNENLGAVFRSVRLAENICGAIREETKRRLIQGEVIPGLKLKQGEAREKIVNLPLIHARAAEHGVTVEEFTAACSLTKKAGKEMLGAKTGKKGKALDAAFGEMIDGCTALGAMPEPSVVLDDEKEAA